MKTLFVFILKKQIMYSIISILLYLLLITKSKTLISYVFLEELCYKYYSIKINLGRNINFQKLLKSKLT